MFPSHDRWVNGVRIDVSEGEEDYESALKSARLKNKRLGYPNLDDSDNDKEYEKQRRALKHLEIKNKNLNID